MANPLLISAAIAMLFALTHLLGARLNFLGTPRSVWLSAAGGISVAYVFVHLLPELAEFQETLSETSVLSGLERHSYLIALIGLAIFYGLDRLAHTAASSAEAGKRDSRPSNGTFWLHLGAFAVYNFLVGYILLHREDGPLSELLLFGFAMAVHFLVNDHALREHHGRVYDRKGRWLLAAAPVAGWALGLATSLSEVLVSAVFALIAGAVILNVLKEELPEERESRFSAFAAGAAAYATLLLMT